MDTVNWIKCGPVVRMAVSEPVIPPIPSVADARQALDEFQQAQSERHIADLVRASRTRQHQARVTFGVTLAASVLLSSIASLLLDRLLP